MTNRSTNVAPGPGNAVVAPSRQPTKATSGKGKKGFAASSVVEMETDHEKLASAVVDTVAIGAASARNSIGKAAVFLGDLNNDGVVDQEDAKIAAAKAKYFALRAANGAGVLGKEVFKHEMAKNAAVGAAIGALVAIPLPIVGPPFGAAVGAIFGVVTGFLSSSVKK